MKQPSYTDHGENCCQVHGCAFGPDNDCPVAGTSPLRDEYEAMKDSTANCIIINAGECTCEKPLRNQYIRGPLRSLVIAGTKRVAPHQEDDSGGEITNEL